MAKRCRYFTKTELKSNDGVVWTTIYDCSKEGHPEYFAGMFPHPACSQCKLGEFIDE